MYWYTHTSDQKTFQDCRLKFLWNSRYGRHLSPMENISSNLWLGSGIHKVLEENYGLKRVNYKDAWKCYVDSFVDAIDEEGNMDLLAFLGASPKPNDNEETELIGEAMLAHYIPWLDNHFFNKYEVITINDKPAVEIPFELDIGMKTKKDEDIIFRGKFDLIVMDKITKEIFIVDWKTASIISDDLLFNNQQAVNYTLAAEQQLNIDVAGVIFVQLSKKPPKPLKILKSGKFSTAVSQRTSHEVAFKQLQEMYGNNIPESYKKLLISLMADETEEGNKFIRVSVINHSEEARWIAFKMLKNTIKEMLSTLENGEDATFISPSKDCSWKCPFKKACQLKFNGDDFEELLSSSFEVGKDHHNEQPWEKDYENSINLLVINKK